ncbi:MAG: oligosaccharide flippase family protein [Algisphaera sp.]
MSTASDTVLEEASPDVQPEAMFSAVEASEAKPEGSLKKKVIHGGAWTAGGVVSTQVLAFASNIILSWVLVPEHFGIMALINTVITGLQMFSDVGIAPCLIQNKREDAAFYNTAWTIQVVRGFILWGVACLLAWPLSQIKPDWAPLATYLPVAALTTVIAGFRSTGYITANRRLSIGKISVVEFTTGLVRTLVMVVVAYQISRTAWALVAGLLVGAIFTTVVSFRMEPDIKNRFAFEKKAFGELISYGKWLFVSTVITFWAAASDMFIIGACLSTSVLGVFWVARRFAELGPMLFQKVGTWVGFPALSETYRNDPEKFNQRLYKLRVAVLVPIMALLLGMILLGPTVIYYGYRNSSDTAYLYAGWMIQVLAVNAIPGLTAASYGNVYMATGRTMYNMLSVAAQFVSVTLCMLVGYSLAGEVGLFLGLGMSQWFKYLADAELASRCGCLQLKFDVVLLLATSGLALLAIWGSSWVWIASLWVF